MGVNWKSSSVFTEGEEPVLAEKREHVVLAQFQRFLAAAAEVQGFFQRQAAVGRIDQRDAAVAADGDVAAGAAAAQHQVVVVEFLARKVHGRVAGAGLAPRPRRRCCPPASGLDRA